MEGSHAPRRRIHPFGLVGRIRLMQNLPHLVHGHLVRCSELVRQHSLKTVTGMTTRPFIRIARAGIIFY